MTVKTFTVLTGYYSEKKYDRRLLTAFIISTWQEKKVMRASF